MADLWWQLGGVVFAVVAVFGLVLLWAGHKDRWPR
jgi:hypothetical protein